MELTNSLLRDLVTEHSRIRPQIYFKSSLIALTRAMQDVVLADREHRYLVIANFQKEQFFQFFRQAERRFHQMATQSDQVYILAVPDIQSSFTLAKPNVDDRSYGLTTEQQCEIVISD